MSIPSYPTKLVKREPPVKKVRTREVVTIISPATWKIRQQVLRQYGGICTCVCGCREANLRRLQLHHVYGSGTDERKQNRGMNWYRTLLHKPNRNDLHVRCVGCHWETTLFGVCEHQGSHTVGSQPQPPVVEVQSNDTAQPEPPKVKSDKEENCTPRHNVVKPTVYDDSYLDVVVPPAPLVIEPETVKRGVLSRWLKKP